MVHSTQSSADWISHLEKPLATFKGVGPRRASELSKRGLATVADLLFRPPASYANFANPMPLRQVQDKENVLVRVTVTQGYTEQYATTGGGRKRRYFTAEARDNSGFLRMQWFHELKSLQGHIVPGADLYVFGTMQRRRGGLQVSHPKIWFASQGERPGVESNYRGFRGASAYWYRDLVATALGGMPDADWWPERTLTDLQLPSLPQTLRQLHQPAADDLDPKHLVPATALKRLRFDTLFGLLYALGRERARSDLQHPYHHEPTHDWYDGIKERLPFQPTPSQTQALETLFAIRGQGQRINSMLHGDVGSGKTLVAALLAAHTIENGLQICLVAPTEILAVQQHRFLTQVFRGQPVAIALLTGSTRSQEKQRILRHCASGKIHIVIGTHAIFDPELRFAKLGLTIVDEQHRFGVEQRQAIRLKEPRSDLLVMSATPIPRSLLMSIYGDLQPISLDQPPAGRQAISTQWLRQDERGEAMNCIKDELEKGHQIYFVYPLVEDNEESELLSAEVAYGKISKYFGEECVSLLHGQMKEGLKQKAFDDFREGTSSILVSTTVIEVGIDVPNATVVVIQNAERFGIAQLHQIRGRVGRSELPSSCYLISDTEPESVAAERLQALCDTQDGFTLAEKDLELRGPGDLFGDKQSGTSTYGSWGLVRDTDQVKKAAELVQTVLKLDPDLESPAYQKLAYWVKRFHRKERIFEGG